MKQIFSLTGVLTVVWLAWSGHYEWLTLTLGAGSIAAVVALCARMQIVDDEGAPLGLRFLRLFAYVPWLTREIIKSNIDVARRIVTPGAPPIAPRVFKVPALQRTDVGRVVYANSITLTPGTITIDVGEDEMLVYALHEEAEAGVVEGTMNRKCAALERDGA